MRETSSVTRRKASRPALLLAVILLLVAAWFRTWQIDRVPPGLHHDEVINAEIVETNILSGHLAVFYDRGGREGLFHLTLAASMRLIGYNSLGFRYAGLAWGMIGLAAAYTLAARLLGQRVALVALAFAATSFWSVYEGRAATRSVSLIAMGALAMLAFFIAWRKARQGQNATPLFALAGALLGLSLYTYIAARVLPLVVILLVIYLALAQHRVLIAHWRGLAIYTIVALMVSAPLIIHLQLYPSADMRFQMLAQPLAELRHGDPRPVLLTTLQTLGIFIWRGDPQWHYNVAGLPLFDPISGALFLIGLVVALRRIKEMPYAFYLVWLLVSLIPGMLSQPAPHYMRTAGAQSAAYTLVGIGSAASIMTLAKNLKSMPVNKSFLTSRQDAEAPSFNSQLCGLVSLRLCVKRCNTAAFHSRVLSLKSLPGKILWLGLAIVWLAATARTYQNFFIIWPTNDEVRFYHQANLSEMARYLDKQTDQTPVVGCSVFLNEHEDWLRSSRQTMHFLLQRADLPIRWNDCRDSLIFPDGGNRWRQFILYLTPLEKNIPPTLLDWFANTPAAKINEFDDIALYTPEAKERLAAALAQASQAKTSWATEAGNGIAPLPVNLGHSLDFLGYQVEKAARQAGKDITLTTYWRASGQSPPFLTIFVHLLDSSGQIVAQTDRQSVLADTLQSGDVFLQIHTIELTPNLSPGEYHLSIGVYSSQTGQRLLLYDGQNARGDRLMLQAITVRPTSP